MTHQERIQKAAKHLYSQTNLTLGACVSRAEEIVKMYLDEPSFDTPPNTIRVRVAVAVDQYGSVGYCRIDDEIYAEQALDSCAQDVDHVVAQCIATIDVPRIPEVQAKVEGTT